VVDHRHQTRNCSSIAGSHMKCMQATNARLVQMLCLTYWDLPCCGTSCARCRAQVCTLFLRCCQPTCALLVCKLATVHWLRLPALAYVLQDATSSAWTKASHPYVGLEASIPVTAAAVVTSSRPSACVATVATSSCCYCYESQSVLYKLVVVNTVQLLLLLLLQTCLVVEVQVGAAECPASSSSSTQCMCISCPSTASCAAPHAEIITR
jgi:hypothetical protein